MKLPACLLAGLLTIGCGETLLQAIARQANSVSWDAALVGRRVEIACSEGATRVRSVSEAEGLTARCARAQATYDRLRAALSLLDLAIASEAPNVGEIMAVVRSEDEQLARDLQEVIAYVESIR